MDKEDENKEVEEEEEEEKKNPTMYHIARENSLSAYGP